jgi:hypothetical protein
MVTIKRERREYNETKRTEGLYRTQNSYKEELTLTNGLCP